MMRVVLFVTLVLVNLLAHSRATGTSRSLVECAPFAIKLEGGTPPYRVAVLQSDRLFGPPLAMIATNVTDRRIDWIVNLAAGHNVTIAVKDDKNATSYSAPMTVSSSNKTDCLPPTTTMTKMDTASQGSIAPATPTASSSSASFDPQSISSLIDSLTNFAATRSKRALVTMTTTTTLPSFNK